MNNGAYYIIVLLIAALVIWRRTRSMYRPIRGNGLRLLWPMLFFLPAISLFLNPEVHMHFMYALLAVCLGVVLSIPLIWTTNYEIREDGQIYAQKNAMFIVAFIVVLAIRIVFRQQLNNIDPQTLTALFMLVAISYILPWRIISFLKFKKIQATRQAA